MECGMNAEWNGMECGMECGLECGMECGLECGMKDESFEITTASTFHTSHRLTL